MPSAEQFAAIRERLEPLSSFVPQQQAARLMLGTQRMFLQSASAFGQMRAELIHTLGSPLARGVLKRYGYHAGFHDGHVLSAEYPQLDTEEQMHLGTLLHEHEGHARIETELEGTRVDLANGVLEIHSRWHDSIEAEQHLAQHGRCNEPACWTLAGYACGHLSYLLRREVVAVETACRVQGHDCCRFRVGFREDMEKHFPGCADDFRRIDLDRLFRELEQTVAAQRRTISELRVQLGAGDSGEPAAFAALIGQSPALRRAIDIARAVAAVSSTVMISGESGTGKELLARGIHDASARAGGPWIALNCATLTESLQSAELFGHVRGAFTGASSDKPGLFEAASGGTLFLDEVGELSASAQAALLRVLQEGVVTRIGEHRERRVDVRIIAATHRELEDCIAAGRFRADLWYRLNVVSIAMPALRERDNDLLILTQALIERFNARFARSVCELDPEVLRLFLRYPWPGNVRELANVLERAVLLCGGERITLHDLPERLIAWRPPVALEPTLASVAESVRQQEREQLVAALRASGGRRHLAAAQLGISRATLWRRLKRHGLD